MRCAWPMTLSCGKTSRRLTCGAVSLVTSVGTSPWCVMGSLLTESGASCPGEYGMIPAAEGRRLRRLAGVVPLAVADWVSVCRESVFVT